MASTHKKVIVRKYDRSSLQGFIMGDLLVQDGSVQVLNISGNVVNLPLENVKDIHFVKEFCDSAALTRKTFISRPRVEGLWIRMEFRDKDLIEGLIPNELTLFGTDGLFLTPPDARSNTQRIFVPRPSIVSLTVLAITGSRARQRRRQEDSRQENMFPL